MPQSAEDRFYPSGRGGHKNLENACGLFSEFLGGRKNQAPVRSPHGTCTLVLATSALAPLARVLVHQGQNRIANSGDVRLVKPLQAGHGCVMPG